MGYTTKFAGAFSITPPLTAEHAAAYRELVDTDRVDMPFGAPKYYLQWEVSKDGARLHWDGNEKFYDYEEWLVWLIAHWFGPRGYAIAGEVKYQGEEIGDTGILRVVDGAVTKIAASFDTKAEGRR